MQGIDQSGSIAEPAFRLFRLFVQCLIFLAAVAASRWGIRTFLLNRRGKSHRWRNSFSAVNLVVLVFLFLLRGPAEKLLTAVGDAIGRLRPQSELGWLSGALVGVYYVAIASSILFLAVYIVGLVYWFADNRIDAWQARLRASGTAVESNPRFHASRITRAGLHSLCYSLATALVLVYFLYGFAIFPRTRIFTGALQRILVPALRDSAQAVENYVPDLGYLFVILLLGWILLKGLKYFFASIRDGTIVFERFPVD